MTIRRAIPLVAAGVLISACSLRNVSCGTPPALQPPPPDLTAASSTPSASGDSAETVRFKIAFLGDSLTAGLNLVSQQAYPAVIQEMFAAEGYTQIESINAGISGDTTAGGRRRVDQVFEPGVRILVVALGGNDALRGLPVEQLRDNLITITDRAKARGIKMILAGMEAPPNFGPAYTAAFRQAYRDVARQQGAILIPFLLDGVAGLPDMNQGDGIHPTAAGAEKVADTVWSALRPLVSPND